VEWCGWDVCEGMKWTGTGVRDPGMVCGGGHGDVWPMCDEGWCTGCVIRGEAGHLCVGVGCEAGPSSRVGVWGVLGVVVLIAGGVLIAGAGRVGRRCVGVCPPPTGHSKSSQKILPRGFPPRDISKPCSWYEDCY
jgi:hypothetical protein